MVGVELVVALARGSVDDLVDDDCRIASDKSFWISGVRIEVHSVVGVAGYEEYHVVGAADREGACVGVGFDSAASVHAGFDTHRPLHAVVVKMTLIEEAVAVDGCHFVNRLRGDEGEFKVLLAAFRLESPHHHAVGIGAEVAARIFHTVGGEADQSHRFVDVEHTAVIAHRRLVDRGVHKQFAHFGIGAEAMAVIVYRAAEFGRHHASGRCFVAFCKQLAYGVERGRIHLAVHGPVLLGPCAGASRP